MEQRESSSIVELWRMGLKLTRGTQPNGSQNLTKMIGKTLSGCCRSLPDLNKSCDRSFRLTDQKK